MKRFLLALLLVLFFAATADARWFGHGGCSDGSCGASKTVTVEKNAPGFHKEVVIQKGSNPNQPRDPKTGRFIKDNDGPPACKDGVCCSKNKTVTVTREGGRCRGWRLFGHRLFRGGCGGCG